MQHRKAIENRWVHMMDNGATDEELSHFANRWAVRLRRKGREWRVWLD